MIFKSITLKLLLISLSFGVITIVGCGKKSPLTPLIPAPDPASADSGMVVAAHPLAAEAGLRVLREGGNAVDAALAAMFMLNVVEPYASGLAGGGFALVYPANGKAKVVIYRDTAPRGLDTSFYFNPTDILTPELDSLLTINTKDEVIKKLNSDTTKLETDEGKVLFDQTFADNRTRALQMESLKRRTATGTSICTPGAPAGWAELLDNWATMPLERLTEDAINAAENGFPVDQFLSSQIKGNLEKILADSLGLASVFLQEGILPYEVGDVLVQKDLAKTLRWLNEHGLRSFYRGPLAESIVYTAQLDGGFLDDSDLIHYRAEITDPITAQLSGRLSSYTLLTVPPPSAGGLTVIETLNLMEQTGVFSYPNLSPQSVHLTSQCMHQAYADADARIGDPKHIKYDWSEMLTDEFLHSARQGISIKSKPTPRAAVPPNKNKPEDHGNTTHLVVVDRWGNAVSITQSINYFFGAGVMAQGTGLIMNNQMADFSIPPDTINTLAPGRRPKSNMAPIIVVNDDKAVLVVGTPGGARIPAALSGIVSNVIGRNMDISNAIDYPRFYRGQFLDIETRLPPKTVKSLHKMGYTMRLAGPYNAYFGGAHGITIDPQTRKIFGAADHRRGGAARGW